MQHEILIIVGEAANTYYRGPGKSKNKNQKNTLSFPETEPLSYQQSEVHACLWLYVMMKLHRGFFPFGRGEPVIRNPSPSRFLFPPFPYLLSLYMKDEDCEALFPLLLLQDSLDKREARAGSIRWCLWEEGTSHQNPVPSILSLPWWFAAAQGSMKHWGTEVSV